MFLPFRYGDTWYCTQGQGGSFSHQGNQYYGFDFNKGSYLNSSANPAYNKPLYSPVNGEVVEIRDGVHDFSNNSSSNSSNNYGWGNTIVIEDENGNYYVRLAHLKYGTIDHLNVGDWVNQGDYIGRVGQTGYSTSPHLHIQIMRSVRGTSYNFTFAEGKLYAGEWITGSLGRNLSMIDNNGEASLSHEFVYAYTQRYGSWYTRTGVDGYAGRNYYSHRVTSSYDTSYFKWRFRVGTSGYYAIYATYPTSSSNEPNAQYNINGQRIKYLNQTQGSSFLHLITFMWINAGIQYYIKLKGKTKNRYLIADSILLRRI